MPTFKKAYDKHVRVTAPSSSPGKTQQHFKRECDINHLMGKYQKTGLIDHVSHHQGDYSDLTDLPTYHDALNKVISAQSSFDSLPSSLRSRFSNDPAQFLDFVSNPDNRAEMVQMGLIPQSQPDPVPEPVPEPDPVEPAGGEPA